MCLALIGQSALAQSTVLTHQGLLKSGGDPASGLHDLRYRLFDAPSGGSQIGSTLCLDNVTVTEGLFTVQIDFGQQFATPNERYLEIEVRKDTGLDCGNASGFAVLAPRQLLTAAPLASHARSAFALDAADGSPSNAVFVDNAGKVGIGTLAPTHTLHVANAAPTLALQDTDSTTQQVGYVSYRDSGNVERAWVGYGSAGDPDFTIFNTRPSGDIVLLTSATGKVGIGTSTPASALDVRGDIRLGPVGQFRAISGEENLRMIRGTVATDGSRLAGDGFVSSRLSVGKYLITFTTPFAQAPSVTVSADAAQDEATWFLAMPDNVAANQSNVTTVNAASFFTDRAFHFIAVGPR